MAGTTGYDALREIGGVFVDPTGVGPLTDLVDSTGADYHAMPPAGARRSRPTPSPTPWPASWAGCAAPSSPRPDIDHPRPARRDRRAAQPRRRVPVGLPGPVGGAADRAGRNRRRSDRNWPSRWRSIAAAVAGGGEAAVRLQQLCGAATAKSMEDCLFYRDAAAGVAQRGRRRARAVRGQRSPSSTSAPRCARGCGRTAMTTLTTHDTKRGEDVRARIGVLSQVPSLWAEFVGAWERRTPSPDPMTGLFLWQNIFGVWPVDGTVDRRRCATACTPTPRRRSAKPPSHTSWNDPDTEFESAVHAWLDAVIDGPVAAELTALVARLDEHARSDALGQKLHRADRARRARRLPGHRTVGGQPGRPRQPPAGRLRRAGATRWQRCEHPKMRVVTAALRLRRDRPTTFLAAATRRCWPTGRPPSTSSRSCAATTCWSRSAAGRSGSPKPAGATRF